MNQNDANMWHIGLKSLQSPHWDILECSELSGPGDGSLLVPPAGEAASRFASQLESFKQEDIQDYGTQE